MISPLNDGAWLGNNRGLVRIEEKAEIKVSEAILKPLTYPTPGQAWHTAINMQATTSAQYSRNSYMAARGHTRHIK